MSDEFAKEVLGEDVVRASRNSGRKAAKGSGSSGKGNGKAKKIGIIVGVVAVVAALIGGGIFLLRPKNKETATYLDGIDVLCAPNAIVKRSDGSFLVADSYCKKIWIVKGNHAEVYAGADTVEDLYGEPMGGYNDDGLLESLFRKPWGITPFLNGYAVSDTANHAIRLVTDSSVQTVNGRSDELEEGDLGVTFDQPTGLATDDAGNLYVADTGRGVIYQISKDGRVNTFWEGLSEPMGICWFGGTLYVAETGENRVISIQNGKMTVAAGNGDEGDTDGPALTANFSSPMGVAVSSDGTIYVADTVNGTVRRVRKGMVDTIFVAQDQELSTSPVSPTGLYMDEEYLYVCDPFARRVCRLPLE